MSGLGSLGGKPDPFKRGQRKISAESLNEIASLLLRQIRGDGSIYVEYLGDRVVIRQKPQFPNYPGTDLYHRQFVVLEEYEDVLKCCPYDPLTNSSGFIVPVYSEEFQTGSMAIIFVAKPYILQQTPWDKLTAPTVPDTLVLYGDGYTYEYTDLGERTAHDETADTDIDEKITPEYFAGDIITAVCTPTGLYGPLGEGVPWMDINAGGRIWSGPASSGNAGEEVRWVKTNSSSLTSDGYDAYYYNKDLASVEEIWVEDANLAVPIVGRFYKGIRGTDQGGRKLFRVDSLKFIDLTIGPFVYSFSSGSCLAVTAQQILTVPDGSSITPPF